MARNPKSEALLENLKRWESIVDIGQIPQPQRRMLNALVIHGVVGREKCYHFPIPKNRYYWIGTV